MLAAATVSAVAAVLVSGFAEVKNEAFSAALATPTNAAPFSAVIAIMLLVPAQLGYVLVRAGHRVPSRQVAGARLLCVLSVAACAACAALLVGAVAAATDRGLDEERHCSCGARALRPPSWLSR